MAADRPDSESTRELRLEGLGLLLGGGVLLALLAGAFFLGRWVERRTGPPALESAAEAGPLARNAARSEDVDAADGITYFDSVEGGEQELEPERELPTPQAEVAEPSAAQPQPAERAARADDGRFFVQVLALRDRSAAAEVIDSLRRKGFGVRLFSEREGQSTLYKVRVGGYPTRPAAEAARDELRKSGHPGAFVWAEG
jgi:cell division septation protein DedD